MQFGTSGRSKSVKSNRSRTPRIVAAAAAGAVLIGGHAAPGAIIWNLAGGGSWNTATNWNPATVPNAVGANATFNGAATGSNPAQTANRTITADGAQTVGSIVFNNDLSTFTNSVTTGTSGSITMDETGSGPATISVPAAAGTGNNTISAPMTLNDNTVAQVDNVTASSAAGALNLTATIGGSGGFTKNGDGLCTFGTGAKSYTGATVVNGGRMRMSSAASPTATSSLTINSGGQLNLISSATYAFGSGSLNLNGAGATTGPFAPFPGAIRNDTGLGVIISNAVNLQSNTVLHVQATAGTGSSANPTGTLQLNGVVSGPGKLTLTAPGSNIDQGSLVLTNDNSYTGGTLVAGGILQVTGAAADLGTGDVTVDNSSSTSSIARLSISAGVVNAIGDGSTLRLLGGGTAGVADQNFAILGAGVNEVVGTLILGGVTEPPGTYGSSTSTATFQMDEYFSGPGIVTVPEPASLTALCLGGFLLVTQRPRRKQ